MAGQIINRGKNVWLVRVPLKGDPGKRTYLNKTIHGTKKDAELWLTQALRQRDLGIEMKPATVPLGEYLLRWLQEAARPKLRSKTFATYQRAIEKYIIPVLGTKPLSRVTPLDVQAVYNGLQKRGLSPRTIQYTNMIFKQALERAIQWRLLTFNPCRGVELPRQQRKEMHHLSPEETARFLSAAKMDRYSAVFELAVTSGLRPSEYFGLKWTDLDWARGTVSVARSLDTKPKGGWEFADNKTGRSRRVVRLHSSVRNSLAEWRQQQEQDHLQAGERWTEFGLIFTNEVGGPLNRHNLTRRHLRPILKRAGLPQIRLYDLRHTAATLALSAGVPIKVISEQLGHASSALTMDVYSHVSPDMQEEAVRKVEEKLRKAVEVKGEAGSLNGKPV